MKLEHLREFVLLAQHLNFNTTASKLYMTQSALSRHISSIEEELGVQLLFRNTQSVSLTQAGTYFLDRITCLLSEYDSLVTETALREQQFDHTLRLGINYYAFNYYLGNIPQHFQLNYPRTKIIYRTGSPDDLIKALLEDELDAILVNHFPFPRANQMEFMDLFQEPYYVLLPSYHPLAVHEKIILSDLIQETFVGVNTSVFSCSWDYIRSRIFGEMGSYPHQRPILFDQLEEATVAVRQGMGLLVEGQILKHLTNPHLVCRPLTGEGCTKTVSIAFKRGNQIPVIAQLIDSYVQQLELGTVPFTNE